MIGLNLQFLLLLLLLFLIIPVKSQSVGDEGDASANFQPSLAIVIGILCVMFSLTFILLIYAKFCHRSTSSSIQADFRNNPALIRSGSRYSGIDKTVIESLPFFRFSSLKGSKEGLECAVCLSKFEDIEFLRLLPKCKHAFHIKCVDQWLERHSSCPLCRCKISAEDPAIFTYSSSMRFIGRDESNIELIVQREESNRQQVVSSSSSRFSIGGSFRKSVKSEKDGDEEEEAILIREDEAANDLHKFNHKIIVSDFVFKNRWSNVSSSDLMSLKSEMLQDISSNRFSSSGLDLNNQQFINGREDEEEDDNKKILKIKEEMEIKRLFESKVSKYNYNNDHCSSSASKEKGPSSSSASIMNEYSASGGRRSISEITGFSRFKNTILESYYSGGNNNNNSNNNNNQNQNQNEEKQRKLWLPIARRTVEWFVNRERRSQQQTNQNKNKIQELDV